MPAAKSWIYSSEKRVKVQNNDTVTGRLGKVQIDRKFHRTKRKQLLTKSNGSSKKEAIFKLSKLTSVKTFFTDPKSTTITNGETSKLTAHEKQTVAGKEAVSSKSTTGHPAMDTEHKSIVKRAVNPAPQSHHRLSTTTRSRRRAVVRRSRRRVSRRRASQRSRRRITSRRRRSTVKTTVTTSTIIRPTTTFVYRKVHPCNNGSNSSSMKYRVKDIECRRLKTSDLQKRMKCLGNYNHQYLATSMQEALKFRDLDTGKKFSFNHSFVWHRSTGRIRKRDEHISPGETLIVKCHAAKTLTESGNLRMCPVCAAITRQPSEPRRFPEYINEVVCDPTAKSSYIPGIDGFCVQKTFTLDLLQFDGDWEKNSELSEKGGHDVYTEKWEAYTQTIKRHCACELLPSSSIASLL